MDSLEGGGYIGNCTEASAARVRGERREGKRERERARKAGVYDSVNR